MDVSTLKIPRQEAENQIQAAIAKAKEIQDMNTMDEAQLSTAHRRLSSWQSVTESFIESIFTDNKYAKEFTSFSGGVHTMASPFETRVHQFDEWVQDSIDKLEVLIGKLPYIPTLQEATTRNPQGTIHDDEPVFVVHGQDEEMNQRVLRFIEKIGLKAIDLREQAGGTLTMQEKLKRYSSVKFAVVLFTADDFGRLKTAQEENPRNRQNVIYELAGFQKQLGDDHVAIIQKDKTELPSDIRGVHYISWNDTYEGWKILLARELKNAGLRFDFNDIL